MVVVFDTETNRKDNPEIVEAALIRLESPTNLEHAGMLHGLYKPIDRIELGAMAVHHIMDEDLVDCPPSASFALPPGTTYIIGHNVDFDWRAAGEPDVKRICTLALCRHLWPEADNHTQTAMLYYLERERARVLSKEAHSALCDVKNCIIILGHILKKLGVMTWEDLYEASEIARIPTTITFGMHKGSKLADLPGSYVSWLLRQNDLDPYLRKALETRR